MARRLLEKEGLSFSVLADIARRSSSSFGQPVFSSAQVQLEARIDQLTDDIAAHVEQNSSLSSQVDLWRRRAFELEQALTMTQAESARWKEVARETAERLWDLGRIAREEAFVSPEPMAEDDVLADVDDLVDSIEPLKAAG